MKKILLHLLAWSAIMVQAQTASLVGIRWNGTNEEVRHVNTSNGGTTLLGSLTPSYYIAGESAYDDVNNRYFVNSVDGLLMIDAITGTVINTYTLNPSLANIAYNPNSGELIGLANVAGGRALASLDLSTGSVSLVTPLTSTESSVAQAMKTFDAAGNRYIYKSATNIHVVDATSGSITAVVTNTKMINFEWHPGLSKLVGVYWTGSQEVFGALDIVSGMMTNTAVIPGVSGIIVADCALDLANNRYFVGTDIGMVTIDIATGSVISTFSPVPAHEFEYVGSIPESTLTAGLVSPAQVNGTAGMSATFTVSVNNPLAATKWQVKKNNVWMDAAGSRYSGTTTNVLTVNGLTLQDDQAQFRCVASTAGWTSYSKPLTLSVALPDGVAAAAKKEISVYPVPAASQLFVEGENVHRLRLLGTNGQVAAESVLRSIDVGALANGIYILEISDASGSVIKRVTVPVQR